MVVSVDSLTLADSILSNVEGLVSELRVVYRDWIGVDQFTGTPQRVARMYGELCWSPERIEVELDKQFRTFDNGFDEMLVHGPLPVFTLCPHHLLPCQFDVTVGYIPKGKVLGLSKIYRVAQTLARRPIMQEQYNTELADAFMARLEPAGVAVYVVGIHGCMTHRGIEQRAPVVTSIIKGVFKQEDATRAEFYALARRLQDLV